MRWDPNKKKPPGENLFFKKRGVTHCFTIVFSYWFSITTTKNPIVHNQKTEVPNQSYFFIWGVSVLGRRDDYPLSLITMFYQFLPTLFLNVSSHWCFAPGTFGLAIVQPQSQLEVLTVDAGSACQGIPRDPRVAKNTMLKKPWALGHGNTLWYNITGKSQFLIGKSTINDYFQ